MKSLSLNLSVLTLLILAGCSKSGDSAATPTAAPNGGLRPQGAYGEASVEYNNLTQEYQAFRNAGCSIQEDYDEGIINCVPGDTVAQLNAARTYKNGLVIFKRKYSGAIVHTSQGDIPVNGQVQAEMRRTIYLLKLEIPRLQNEARWQRRG